MPKWSKRIQAEYPWKEDFLMKNDSFYLMMKTRSSVHVRALVT